MNDVPESDSGLSDEDIDWALRVATPDTADERRAPPPPSETLAEVDLKLREALRAELISEGLLPARGAANSYAEQSRRAERTADDEREAAAGRPNDDERR